MTSDPTLKRPFKEVQNEILREVFTPATIGWFIVVLTMPFWITPVIYLLLRTLLFDPNAMIVWTLLIGISCFSLWTMFGFFKAIISFSKQMRPVVIASKNGDAEATRQRMELRKQRPKPHGFIYGLWAIHLVIPLIVVIILSQGPEAGAYLIRDHGKLRHSTKQESIQNMIKSIEHQRFFRPVGN